MSWFDDFADRLLRLAGVDQSKSYDVPRQPQAVVRPAPRPDGSTYWAYTTEFDVEAPVALLDMLIGTPSDDERARMRARWATIDLDVEAMTAWVDANRDDGAAADTAVVLLLDHSGSLRNGLLELEAMAAKGFVHAMARLGISYEVLGHTTLSWKGGRAAEKWRSAGAQPMPGRLCDLLHLVYGDEASLNEDDSALAGMFHPRLLRENVDGEAVEWALARLRAKPQRRKLLLIVSDGAPSDDSTTARNGLGMLHYHLKDVVASTQDVQLAAIQLGSASTPYANAVSVTSAGEVQPALLRALETLLRSPTAA